MNSLVFYPILVNIIIYIVYVVTVVLTSTVLKGKHERIPVDVQRDIPEAVTIPSSARDYMSRSTNPYNSQSSFMKGTRASLMSPPPPELRNKGSLEPGNAPEPHTLQADSLRVSRELG